MARFPIIVDSSVRAGEVTVVRELDNDTIYLDPIGVRFLSTQNELGAEVVSVSATLADVSFDSAVGSSIASATVSTATLTIPNNAPTVSVSVDGAAPAAITSIVFAPTLRAGQLKTIIIANNAGQTRTFRVFDPANAYLLPEGSDVMSLEPSQIGIISFIVSSSIIATFKGGFNV